MIIIDCEQQSELWHQVRCGRVTGTRFEELLSIESSIGYKKLLTNIACEIITGRADEDYHNQYMKDGIELEPEAIAEYESIADIKVKKAGFIIPDEDNKYHEWIGISPDGLLPDNGMIEIKCPLMRTHFEYIEANKLPSEYRRQIQGQLFVTGLKYCDFVSYVKNMKIFIIRVFPDLKLFKNIELRLENLIEQVKNKLGIYQKYDYFS